MDPSKAKHIRRLASWVSLLLAVPMVGCTGDPGPQGDQGPRGEIGEQGEVGMPGDPGDPGDPGLSCWDLDEDNLCDDDEDKNHDGDCDALDCQGTTPEIAYVGSAACKICHSQVGAKFAKSGHAAAMVAVSGAKPTYAFDGTTGGLPANPPASLTWSNISYVIGGFGWKANYVGDDGNLVTGAAAATTQWNFANSQVGTTAGFVAFHDGETLATDCGQCHTTGWVPCEVGDDSCVHQGDLAGMAGSFVEPGVQCEACHGPGSAHVNNPYLVKPKIDRDPEACGKCHSRDQVEVVDAEGGFIHQYQQWDEMFQSKKHIMRCIDCHDPHASAKFVEATVNPNKGIRVACESCHVGYTDNQKSLNMPGFVTCIDCHMPRIDKSAVADAAKWSGDMRSHLFAINSDVAIGQFTGGGAEAMPFVSLEFACRNCHRTDSSGPWSAKSDAELEVLATDYHSAP